MPADPKYGGYSADPLAALEKRQLVTRKTLVKGLKTSLDAIKGRIASAKTPAFAASQQKLFDEIAATYAEMAAASDKYLKDEVTAAALLGGRAAAKDAAASGVALVKWSEARARRYWKYVNPQQGKNLAAVFTDKMAADTIAALRQSVVEVTRRAAIEGMSLKDQHKAIQESWNRLTGDDSNFQFVDRSGKAWDNARYLQMLSRTTAQRVYRDSYADRLAESGFKLVRITSLGAADCPVCKAWQGVICAIAGGDGKYPTIEQARAAGVWHPNCMCSMEYVDEDLDAEDIEAQAEAGPVDWTDEDAVQKRTDDIALDKFKAQGMDEAEAADALTRAKVEEAIRTELFLENSEDLANGFSHEQLEDFRKNGVPEFVLTKGKQKPEVADGTVYIDRKNPEESLHDILGVTPVHVEPPPPPPKWEPDFAALELAKVKVAEALQRAKEAKDAIETAPASITEINALLSEWSALVDLSSVSGSATQFATKLDEAKSKAETAVAAIDAAVLEGLAVPTAEASQKAFDTKVAEIAAAAAEQAKAAETEKTKAAEVVRIIGWTLTVAKQKVDKFKADTVDAATVEADAADQDAAALHDLSKAARNEMDKLKKAAGLIK